MSESATIEFTQIALNYRFEECKNTFPDGCKVKVVHPYTEHYGKVFTVQNVIKYNNTVYIKTVEKVGCCPALILAEWCSVHVDEDKQCLKYVPNKKDVIKGLLEQALKLLED